MKKIKLYFYLTMLLSLTANAINATITFRGPNTANVCKATGYTIEVRDEPVSLTIILNTVVKQGTTIVSLPPYPNCGVGLPNNGTISPAQAVNTVIANASCQPLTIQATVNQGTYTWVVSSTSCTGTVSYDLKYDIILDCALIPQNFQTIQNLSLEQTCSVNGNSQSIIALVPLPHILNAPTISIPGNFGQTGVDMVFEYQNNGNAAIDIVFGFEDKYLGTCASPAYTLNYSKYAKGTSVPLPANFPYTLSAGVNNTITIPAGQYLYILQNVDITGCYTSCANDRKVELKWQCANSLQNYQFCTECQQQYVTQFTFNAEVTTFTVERMLPTLGVAEYDTKCFGDYTEWSVRVTNTSQYATLPNVRVHLQSGSYGAAGLSVIYDGTIIQDPIAANTNCTNCSLSKTSSLGNPSSACYSGGALGNSYGAYDVDVSGLKHGEFLTFKFKTSKCCNSSSALFGSNKAFNHWMASSTATTGCNTYINNPTPAISGNDLALSAAGNISQHLNTSDDLDLSLAFNPSYPSDFTVNTAQYNYMYPPPNTTNQKIDFGGMFGDNYDKAMFGYTTANPTVTGILKAQINCGLGLVVCNTANVILE